MGPLGALGVIPKLFRVDGSSEWMAIPSGWLSRMAPNHLLLGQLGIWACMGRFRAILEFCWGQFGADWASGLHGSILSYFEALLGLIWSCLDIWVSKG